MTNHSLRIFAVLPPVLLNVWAVVLYVPYYAFVYTRPDLVAGVTPGQITVVNYAFLVIVEWALALSILRRLRRDGTSLRRVLSREGRLLSFAPLPALAVMAAVGLLSAGYFALAGRLYGDALSNSYVGLALWQRLTLVAVVPVTAAFCEELIWRAYIPRVMEARGWGFWRIVVLSSLSFAAIHGVFFPDKLVWTFLFGAILTTYYLKKRSLVPAVAVHWLVDVGSFAVLLFG